jgi:hypothetical protein
MMINDDEDERFFQEAFAALHRCWTKAVGTPGYVKADWRILDGAISRLPHVRRG